MAKNIKTAQTVETEVVQVQEVTHDVAALMEQHKTKSAVIRYLAGQGLKTGAINKAFETAGIKMRYQHVRNVLVTPTKK